MDFLQDIASRYLTDGPAARNPNANDDALAHVRNLLATSLPWLYSSYTFFTTLTRTFLAPLLSSLGNTKPDIVSLAALLLVLFLSLKLVNMMAQTVLFWYRMVKALMFWGTLVGLAAWMWSRGPDGVGRDVEGLWETWKGEYEYWQDRDQMARVVNGNGGGRGFF